MHFCGVASGVLSKRRALLQCVAVAISALNIADGERTWRTNFAVRDILWPRRANLAKFLRGATKRIGGEFFEKRDSNWRILLHYDKAYCGEFFEKWDSN